ncbi:LysR family transcriptional regulator [Cohnella candidum]|uniref:LysR family transcriptional regulator n=1 Tax=Cohnella candidum TaxID=2674991 RepID=A0A3G3K251_9BACL|nr:LysR family transcriptional regulator [Cohnella candidum]AYQ74548.1 LysR family transcriptional regulator [Cohnella candidum]
MNLDYWRAFLETARTGSMAKASDKLGLTSPALGKQIRALEGYYGSPLFIRSSSGVELTSEGRLLLARLQPLVEAHENLMEELRSLQLSAKAVTIGTIPSLSQHYVPEVYLSLQNAGYRVNVEVRHTSQEVLELLAARKADVALAESSSVASSLWSKEMIREPYHLVMPSGDPLADRESLSPEDWAGMPLVVYPESCSIRRTVEGRLLRHGLALSIGKEIGFGESAGAYVAAGAGMAVIPLRTAGQLADPRLKAVPMTGFPEERSVSLIARTAQEAKPLLRHFAFAFR